MAFDMRAISKQSTCYTSVTMIHDALCIKCSFLHNWAAIRLSSMRASIGPKRSRDSSHATSKEAYDHANSARREKNPRVEEAPVSP